MDPFKEALQGKGKVVSTLLKILKYWNISSIKYTKDTKEEYFVLVAKSFCAQLV